MSKYALIFSEIFIAVALISSFFGLIKYLTRKKEYTYFITYFHHNGQGCACIIRDRKIDSWDEIQRLRKFIEEKNGLENVVVINYRRLK